MSLTGRDHIELMAMALGNLSGAWYRYMRVLGVVS